MPFPRALCLAVFFAPAVASARDTHVATPWQKAQSSQARLIAPLPGKSSADGWLYGALELTLPQDAKTYWRTAGETGVPPTFSFDGSQGVDTPEALFPAPVAFDDGVGGVAYGYPGGVIFPIRFKVGAGAAYTLSVSVDYGVCLKTMCVPAQAKLTATPAGVGEAGLTELVQAARKRVPVAANGSGPLAVTAVSAAPDKDGMTLTVAIRNETSAAARVFVEADEMFVPNGETAGEGKVRLFRFRAQRAGETKPWGNARITVAADDAAIEATVPIDAAITR